MTSGLSLTLYLNSLVYHRNIFGSSSEVFGNLRTSSEIFRNSRKMLGNVRLVFGTILENLRKSSEGGRKYSENHQKRRHQHVYIIKEHYTATLRYEFYFLVAKTIFYSLAALVRKILFCHSKIKFISSRHRVISSIYFRRSQDNPGCRIWNKLKLMEISRRGLLPFCKQAMHF